MELGGSLATFFKNKGKAGATCQKGASQNDPICSVNAESQHQYIFLI
jgi:hypothetical protein